MKRFLSLVLSILLTFSSLLCVPEFIFAETEQGSQAESVEQANVNNGDDFDSSDNDPDSAVSDEAEFNSEDSLVNSTSEENNLSEEFEVLYAKGKQDFYKKVSELIRNQDENVTSSDSNSIYESARLIIKTKEDLDLSTYDGICQAITDNKLYYVVQFRTSKQAKYAAKLLQCLDIIDYVEPDQEIEIEYENQTETDKDNVMDTETASSHNSWGIERLGVDEYASYAKKKSTDQIVVAVVDTGVNVNHTYLEGRTVSGYDFVDSDTNADDGNGHGTHVSGTVVDCTLYNTNIKIMPIRVLNDSGKGYTSNIANGIKYAADNDADIINMSLGGTHSGSYMEDAVSYATGKGVVNVVASGNESSDTSSKCPAHIEEAITVGAIDSTNTIAYFSNYGAAVDVVAPGKNISSCDYSDNTGYESMSGTSMATPHIAGCVALIKQANPDFTISEIDEELKKCCLDLGASGRDDYYGEGLPQLDKLIDENYEIVSSWTELESEHSFSENSDKTWQYTSKKNPSSLAITFDANTYVDNDNYIYIYDKTGNEIGQYSGNDLSSKTVVVDGNQVKIRLAMNTVDSSWGFKVTDLKNRYQVNYDANGGSGAPSNTYKEECTDFTISNVVPVKKSTVSFDANGGTVSEESREIYAEFANWNTKADGSGTDYYGNGTYSTDEAVTFYAKWNEGVIDNLPTPVKESGETFAGWYTSDGTKVENGDTISSDTNLIAKWGCTLTYDANGGSGAPSPVTNVSGTKISISRTVPSRSYVLTYDANGGTVSTTSSSHSASFKSWNTKKDGSGTTYTRFSKIELNENITLYAQYNTVYIYSIPTPSREGHTFVGWYTEDGEKIAKYSAISDDHTLKAKWNCTLTFNANGGTGAPSAVSGTTDSSVNIPNTTPEKSYTITYDANGGSVSNQTQSVSISFKSWNTQADGNGTDYLIGSEYRLNGNATLYAQWGTAKVSSLETPTRTGFNFLGWYTEEGDKVENGSEIKENLTLVAHWNCDLSNATLELGSDHYAYYNSEVKPSVVVKVGDTVIDSENYTVSYSNNKAAGTGTVTVNSKSGGICTGSISKDFEIHTLSKVSGKSATCTEKGSDEYYSCSCGKYFSDSDCKTEISENSWVIDALGHNWDDGEVTKPSTCTEKGVKTYHCTRKGCQETYTDDVDMLLHDYKTISLKPATVDEDGYSQYRECKDCQHIDGKNVIKQIDATTIELTETSFIVDGTEHKPVLKTIKDVDGNVLNSGTDYDVSYSNNIYASTKDVVGKAVITFKGNYSGEVTREFTINKTDTTGMTVELDKTEFTYDGTEKKPNVTVYNAGGNVIASSNYNVSYKNNTNAGDASVTVEFMGEYYEGTLVTNFTIKKAQHTLNVEQDKIIVRKGKSVQINATSSGDVVYTCSDNLIARVSKSGLVNGVSIGSTTVTLEIAGDDNHLGITKTIDVVVPIVISSAKLAKTTYTYNGDVQKPTVATVNGSTELIENVDYKVTYRNSVGNICEEPTNVDTYKVIITGTGLCDGSVNLSYTITQATKTITTDSSAITAYISKTQPTLTATTVDGVVISYKINSTKYASISITGGKCTIVPKKAGSATITITAPASKNYKAASKTVKITVKDPVNINSTKVTTFGKAVWNGGSEINPTVTVKSGKTTFKEDTDYKVRYDLVNTGVGTVEDWDVGDKVKVTVTADADSSMLECKGTIIKYIEIVKATQPATATAPSTIYYGSGKEPVKIDISGLPKSGTSVPASDDDENPTITYKSSNTKYAKVDSNGNIIPIKKGKVTITINIGATTHYAAKTIKLTVNVKPATKLTSKNVKITAGYNDGEDVVPNVTVSGFKKGEDYTVGYEYTKMYETQGGGQLAKAFAIGDPIQVTVKAITASGGCLGEYTTIVKVGKGEQSITIDNKPTTVKVKATTPVFTISGVKDSANVSLTTKTYAKIKDLGKDQDGNSQYAIIGVKKGTATVTVKLAGTELYNAKTLTFKVKVAK